MKAFLPAAASLLLAMQAAAAPAQVVHDHKAVSDIVQDGTRPCLFFRLVGVDVADPAHSTHWFAIPRTHSAFAESFALLVTARAARLNVRVTTTGTASCGLATVDEIYLRG